MSNLQGKKLLVLGGGAAAYPVVKTAKQMGLYVIAVDYLEGGAAKEIADEQHLISTTDFDAMLQLIREKRIDGVFCGASEFNIQNMIKLTQMAGLPCYCNMQQWELMQNKANFKRVCREYGVPVVPEYPSDTAPENITYPVFVKPTDGSSSRGLTLVRSAEELPKAIEYAKEYSACKNVIIERFMDCKDISAFYAIQDGVVSLSHLVDIFRYNNREGVPTITSCVMYPSCLLERYLEKMDDKVKAMISGIGMSNGFVSFQFFTENGEFYAIECCLRISGNYDYPIIERINDISYMKMMIAYAVSGSMGEKNAAAHNVRSKSSNHASGGNGWRNRWSGQNYCPQKLSCDEQTGI